MTGEFRLAEITTVKDGLLDSRVTHDTESFNGALQSQWEVIRDGLSRGVSARTEEARENSLLTGVEIAGSFGLGAAMTYAMKTGGRWATAAELGGAAMLGMMGVDLGRRGMAIHEAYKSTSAETLYGQQVRKDAIAQYAGAGVVDYSLMLASGGLGAATVHFGPKLATRLSTTLEPLSGFGRMEPALQPARVSSFRLMDLGESGRLGAREVKALDPVSQARERLEFPHRSVGLDQLQALVEAKQIAAHPEVRPIHEKIADTLGKVDSVKPLLSKDEAALSALNKELADIKTLKPEMQAVRSAESAIAGLKADLERVPALREEQASLTRQIQEAKSAKDAAAKDAGADAQAKKGGKEKEAPVDSEALRARRREVSDSIAGIQSRAQELPRLEQRLAEARQQFSARKDAIEAGTDAQVLAVEAQMLPLRESVAARQSELGSLTEQLKVLDREYQAKADAVKPLLKDVDASAIPSVPRYTRPKIDLPEPPVAPKKVEKVVSADKAQSQARAPERVAEPEKPLSRKAEKTAGREPEKTADRTERKTEQTAPVERAVGEQDVNRAFSEAKRAVDDFAATHKRHTTALKKVNDYIDSAFSWFASDAQAAANASKVAGNVDTLLTKLENWERAPGWIRSSDRAQIMQRNGFDAAAMERFDKWFQTQNRSFSESRNMMPDRRLVEIQQHLSRRVAVESVKNWLRTAPDVQAAVSPIVQKGFDIVASGALPDGRAIPKGSDMIVFERKAVKGAGGEAIETILPFAKDGQHMQRFDDLKISAGLAKLEAMLKGGPEAIKTSDLYGFRLDHDPSRLMASSDQVGFAILRPGGQYGKSILYMDFVEGLSPSVIPKSLRADGPKGPGTNTGVLYNMLRNSNKPQ